MKITCDRCPKCGSDQTKVLSAIRLKSVDVKTRRRECICGYRWSTIEVSFDSIRELRAFVRKAEDEKTCQMCEWFFADGVDSGICTCRKSEHCTEYVTLDSYCTCWEG